MTDQDTVLALNRAFYRAFATQDMTAMEALWARRLPIACLHPGWTPLVGRDVVLGSWREVLTQPVAPDIHARGEVVHLFGDTALVLCEEVLAAAVLAAANLFAREDGEWRLVHHQAGPIAAGVPTRRDPKPQPPRRLH